MVAAYCLEQDPGFRNTPIKERFTPFLGANGSTQKLYVAVGHPRVVRRVLLDGRTSRSHLGLVACTSPAHFHGEEVRGWQETIGRTTGALPAMTPSSRKKALESNPQRPGTPRLRQFRSCRDGWR